jgi:hypothetical protein
VILDDIGVITAGTESGGNKLAGIWNVGGGYAILAVGRSQTSINLQQEGTLARVVPRM